MYAIIIGDSGLCIVNSPAFSGGDDILVEMSSGQPLIN